MTDWSLFLKDEQDRYRYHNVLQRYILENLSSLVGQLGDTSSRVQIPPQTDYRIRFQTVPIKVFEDDGVNGMSFQPTDATGNGAPDLHFGQDLGREDIADILLQQLELPDLELRPPTTVAWEDVQWSSLRPSGILPLLAKRPTVHAAKARQARQSAPDTIQQPDLRFLSMSTGRSTTSAQVLAILDVSSSMQSLERRIAQILFYWTFRFLALKYASVDIRYIVHHTRAFEVSPQQFFTVEDDGGTIYSKAYEAAEAIIQSDSGMHPNRYLLHVSDGDNRASDNAKAAAAAAALASQVNLFGYVEIQRPGEVSDFWQRLEDRPKSLRCARIADYTHIFAALQHLFSRGGSTL